MIFFFLYFKIFKKNIRVAEMSALKLIEIKLRKVGQREREKVVNIW